MTVSLAGGHGIKGVACGMANQNLVKITELVLGICVMVVTWIAIIRGVGVFLELPHIPAPVEIGQSGLQIQITRPCTLILAVIAERSVALDTEKPDCCSILHDFTAGVMNIGVLHFRR
jgi:hypothetical protein